MISLCLWPMLAFSALLSTGSSQAYLPILSPFDKNGDLEPFTIYCDANRFKLSPENQNAKGIDRIEISYENLYPNGSRVHKRIWRLTPEYEVLYDQRVPEGRDWEVFEGETKWGSDNIESMTLEIVVLDPKCEDTGSYICSVNFVQQDRKYHKLTRGERLEYFKCPGYRWSR